MSNNTAHISNVQRFTIHDGPGVRTEIFFKGCSLHCKWCSNPETISLGTEIGLYPSKCIGLDVCGTCREVCPLGDDTPLEFGEDGKIVGIDRERCPEDCALCAVDCFPEALKAWGYETTVDELMEIILKDRLFFITSGGGVTLSGGEVLLQSDVATEILKRCKEENIDTCVETALNVKWENVEKVLPYLDMLITDIKTMNTPIFEEYIGSGQERVLDNVRKAVEAGVNTVVRIPLLPGINDDEESLEKTADFILNDLGNKIVQLQILPYRRLGEEKYESLGLEYPMDSDPRVVNANDPDMLSPDSVKKRVSEVAAFFRSKGINAHEGANEILN